MSTHFLRTALLPGLLLGLLPSCNLGIDGTKVFIKDLNGRPTPIVDHGRPIPELIA